MCEGLVVRGLFCIMALAVPYHMPVTTFNLRNVFCVEGRRALWFTTMCNFRCQFRNGHRETVQLLIECRAKVNKAGCLGF